MSLIQNHKHASEHTLPEHIPTRNSHCEAITALVIGIITIAAGAALLISAAYNMLPAGINALGANISGGLFIGAGALCFSLMCCFLKKEQPMEEELTVIDPLESSSEETQTETETEEDYDEESCSGIEEMCKFSYTEEIPSFVIPEGSVAHFFPTDMIVSVANLTASNKDLLALSLTCKHYFETIKVQCQEKFRHSLAKIRFEMTALHFWHSSLGSGSGDFCLQEAIKRCPIRHYPIFWNTIEQTLALIKEKNKPSSVLETLAFMLDSFLLTDSKKAEQVALEIIEIANHLHDQEKISESDRNSILYHCLGALCHDLSHASVIARQTTTTIQGLQIQTLVHSYLYTKNVQALAGIKELHGSRKILCLTELLQKIQLQGKEATQSLIPLILEDCLSLLKKDDHEDVFVELAKSYSWIGDFEGALLLLENEMSTMLKGLMIQTIASNIDKDTENALGLLTTLFEQANHLKANETQGTCDHSILQSTLHTIASQFSFFEPLKTLQILNDNNNLYYPYSMVHYYLRINNIQMAESYAKDVPSGFYFTTQILIAKQYALNGQREKAIDLLELALQVISTPLFDEHSLEYKIAQRIDIAQCMASFCQSRAKEIIKLAFTTLDQAEIARKNHDLVFKLFKVYVTLDPLECYETLKNIMWMDDGLKAYCLLSTAQEIG